MIMMTPARITCGQKNKGKKSETSWRVLLFVELQRLLDLLFMGTSAGNQPGKAPGYPKNGSERPKEGELRYLL
jgi:hypothetical protein